jgi:hypothetical protein
MSALRTGFSSKQQAPGRVTIITGRKARSIGHKAAYAEERRAKALGYIVVKPNLFV